MFRLAKKDEPIKWPVTINIPKDGGSVYQAKIDVYFIVKPEDEIADLSAQGDYEFMKAVIGEPGWVSVQDADGNELPFNQENLETLIRIPYVKSAFVASYFQFVGGIGRKNSRTRHAGG